MSSGTSVPLIEKADKICKLLVEHYGHKIAERKLPPIDELVLTILSQHTNDINMHRAFESLKNRYTTWDEVKDAPQEELAEVIRSSGMYRLKAKRIQATLSKIEERVGKLDISFLSEWELEEARDWLTSLYGVGPKTAAIVLLFSFGMPALPVDTHVWRVTKRLGLIPEKTTREKAHVLLSHIIKGDCIYSLNNNLVRHGREVCKSQRPRCSECILERLCDYTS